MVVWAGLGKMVICGAGQNLAITKWPRSTDLELEGLKANPTDNGKFIGFDPVLGMRNLSKQKKNENVALQFLHTYPMSTQRWQHLIPELYWNLPGETPRALFWIVHSSQNVDSAPAISMGTVHILAVSQRCPHCVKSVL